MRIEWPNGVPQTVYFPGTDQDVIENEILKGSCAFLYAWDGERFRFVTDVMWRSALGMPLGLMAGGAATAYAPAGASQEYLRIPGTALKPRSGKYSLQLTEELWETAYADQLQLLAVDHPDSVDVFVDEHFVPPGPVQLRLFHVVHPHPPLSAVDDRGNDVLTALREKDDQYVSNLTPLRYQGLVEPHDLILDLGPDAAADSTFLFLRGWIYPTDASINVALSQQSQLTPMMPSLDVRDAHGQWTTVAPNLGFPSGKDKTMVVPLSGIFPTGDHHVRIRTNLQIYWDQAFVARDVATAPVRTTRLEALSADLHFRGYSRTYRKGGRYGPWWFDYDSVTKGPMWRPIEGAFTRFGDVLPLLQSSDDKYVIMAPGDEATLQFDAASADSIPRGWKRDFLLYTDGWIKDSDLNTAFGTTVGPLPFHAIREYPYARGDSYPSDAAHQRYLQQYNTRGAAPIVSTIGQYGIRMTRHFATLFDHSVVRPDATCEMVTHACEVASYLRTATLTVQPHYIGVAKHELRGTGVLVGSVVGFPHGNETPAMKEYQANAVLDLGAGEIDMVMNIPALKNRDQTVFMRDIEGVVAAAEAHGSLVKVITENCLLTDAEKRQACTWIAETGAHFVKTSTAYAAGGATVDDVRLMFDAVAGRCRVKAAGGVRTIGDVLAFLEAGARRFGSTRTEQFVAAFDELEAEHRHAFDPFLRP